MTCTFSENITFTRRDAAVADLLSYDGKRVVVTGAASGMGASTARMVRELGGEVVALDIRKPETPVAEFIQIDLNDRASIEAAVAELGDAPIDAVFNCAGLPNTFPGQQVMAVNFLGHRHLTEALVPKMRKGGAIAFVASVGGLNWMSHMAELGELAGITDYDAARQWCEDHDTLVAEGYSLSKEAITYYTMARCGDLLKKGIRINCLSPGPTDTAMMPKFEEAMGKQYMDDFPKPIGRNSTADEQAAILVFLNSSAASYIAGHNLMADGGFLAGIMTGQIDPAALMPS
jgi:NAD(P)-dependent dehydrogenase (short-subunit alcohol dehydrogenase family)